MIRKFALIDLSSIFAKHWHASVHEETSTCYNKTIQEVVSYAAGFDYVAVCVDSPPYNRKQIDPQYKENREKKPQMYFSLLGQVREKLTQDGYWVVGADGYEADDVIATLVREVYAIDNIEVVIYSADKDLMQLVSDEIDMVSTASGQRYDYGAVCQKFGVGPRLVGDLLALVGDSSDNVSGVKGVGVKTAAKWLQDLGSLEGVLSNIQALPERFQSVIEESKESIRQSRKLIELQQAPIDCSELFKPRKAKEMVAEEEQVVVAPEVVEQKQASNEPQKALQVTSKPQAAASFDQALEPMDMHQAKQVAGYFYESKLFGNWQSPHQVFAAIVAGRELNVGAAASLRGFYFIKGRLSMYADMMLALVKRNALCEYFSLVESTNEVATYKTKRKGYPEETKLSYTIEQAKTAGLSSNPNYQKNPSAMLRARCVAALVRIEYPDLFMGIYCVEELD